MDGHPERAAWPTKCPECGAAVFFYRDGLGSRVYFDSLGAPWPVHPCTDRNSKSHLSGARVAHFTVLDNASDAWTGAQLLICERTDDRALIGVIPSRRVRLASGASIGINERSFLYDLNDDSPAEGILTSTTDLRIYRRRDGSSNTVVASTSTGYSRCQVMDVLTTRPGGATVVLRVEGVDLIRIHPGWLPGFHVGDFAIADWANKTLRYEGWRRDIDVPFLLPNP